MGAVAYVNGRYRALADAAVNIEDRGFQFGDGIYEVVYVQDGRLIDAPLHMARLERSLREIQIFAPMTPGALRVVMTEVLRRNRIMTGLVYIQISRGVARRDHGFPAAPVRPSLIVTARHRPAPPRDAAAWAGSAVTAPDERWARCDIKSTNLLPNVLAKQKARLAGAYEAILYDAAETVTEGASSSVWMVDGSGTLLTRQLGREILPGCTRAALLDELRAQGIPFAETKFSLAGLRAATEIFVTSATSFVKPITVLDGAPVGDGAPGPVTTALFERYLRHMQTA
jgi:D-alanine transaminase